MEDIKKQKIKKGLLNLLFMVLGCVFYGAGTIVFLQPETIVAGGITGLAIMVNALVPQAQVGLLIIIFNVPILLLAVKQRGIVFVLKCLFTLTVLYGITALLAFVPPITADNRLLSAIYGGVLQGIGIGCYVRSDYSSGGTELLGRLIADWFKIGKIAICIGILDAVVVISGTLVTHDPLNMLYAIITIYAETKVSEVIITGLDMSKLCFIITDKGKEVSDELIKHSARGITKLEGTGMYTDLNHDVLMTCVKRRQLMELKKIVKSVDDKAFIIINDSVEVRGKGFDKL